MRHQWEELGTRGLKDQGRTARITDHNQEPRTSRKGQLLKVETKISESIKAKKQGLKPKGPKIRIKRQQSGSRVENKEQGPRIQTAKSSIKG
jgi:hypothetical protein